MWLMWRHSPDTYKVPGFGCQVKGAIAFPILQRMIRSEAQQKLHQAAIAWHLRKTQAKREELTEAGQSKRAPESTTSTSTSTVNQVRTLRPCSSRAHAMWSAVWFLVLAW